ncbi:MAG TPA: hypothetical protein VKS79_24765, partial [Gemmataceae bacterium]|nr:hypothetical protein [Gemmataceae bacterium]
MSLADRSPKALTDSLELDYFRRQRWPRRLRTWAAVGAAVLAVVAFIAAVGASGQRSFQAGPVAEPHAGFADDCAKCHGESFRTASKFWTSSPHFATPDAACLHCHEAGRHAARQTENTGTNDQASNCAGCHREHLGQSLVRLSDRYCTQCHANLAQHTSGGPAKYANTIHDFAGHPEFGAWRNEQLKDPGSIRFNHQVHLALPATLLDSEKLSEAERKARRERLGEMAPAFENLNQQQCQYCHEPDAGRRYMKPVRYDNHCSTCHPLRVPIVASWTDEKSRSLALAISGERLHHPGPGQTAANVRGECLEHLFRFLAKAGTPSAMKQEPARPPILDRPLTNTDRSWAEARRAEIERILYRPQSEFARVNDTVLWSQAGCAYCHQEKTAPDQRPNGLPEYEPPQQQSRWFPHAEFN